MYALSRRILALALGGALLSLAGCGDSTAPDDQMTPEEAGELATQMGLHLVGGAAGLASSAAAGGATFNAVPEPFDLSIDINVGCPRGGSTRLTATIDGVFDELTETGTIDVAGTIRPNNCGYPVHGQTFRTTGTLTSTAHMEVENGLPIGTHTASLAGEFEWRASDGRRGRCTVDFAASANYTTEVARVNGSFCGSTIQFTGPLTSN